VRKVTNDLDMQKAIFVEEIGKPMTLQSRPIPEPLGGYALIKVMATMRKFLTATY
jgi:hypothetical protein